MGAYVLVFALGGMAVACGWMIFLAAGRTQASTSLTNEPPASPSPANPRRAKSLADLMERKGEQLADLDIAEMNLLCAAGLPGAEKLDVAKCLAQLDEWAARVQAETDRRTQLTTSSGLSGFSSKAARPSWAAPKPLHC